MIEKALREEFERLMDNAERIWQTTYDTHDLEPYLLAILKFLKKNLDSKDLLEQYMVELVQKPRWRVSLDVIEFCMFELRWSKVKKAAEDLVAYTQEVQDVRRRDVVWKIPLAFSDDWDGAEFYDYYSKK